MVRLALAVTCFWAACTLAGAGGEGEERSGDSLATAIPQDENGWFIARSHELPAEPQEEDTLIYTDTWSGDAKYELVTAEEDANTSSE